MTGEYILERRKQSLLMAFYPNIFYELHIRQKKSVLECWQILSKGQVFYFLNDYTN